MTTQINDTLSQIETELRKIRMVLQDYHKLTIKWQRDYFSNSTPSPSPMNLSIPKKCLLIAKVIDPTLKECGIHYSYECCGRHQIPDYFTDLNACHEMEKVLVGDLVKLHNDPVTYRRWQEYKSLLNQNIHSTADQRAEAFGVVFGLWS